MAIATIREKLTKQEAGYIGDPMSRIECGTCVYFRHHENRSLTIGTCQFVTGIIDEHGCCNLWRRRRYEYANNWLSGRDAEAKLDERF